MDMHEFSRLENGMVLTTHRDPALNSAAVGVWIAAGGRYESETNNGISHFFEHIAFKGTKKRNYRQIKEGIEGRGGILNGFTSEECTCFLAKVLKSETDNALEILIDLVMNPRLDPKSIFKERQVIHEELRMYLDLPHHLAYEELMRLLWPEHPLGRNLVGSYETLAKIDRGALTAYHRKFFYPANMVVSAAGNVKHAAVARLLEKLLRGFSSGTGVKKPQFMPAAGAAGAREILKIVTKPLEQTHLYLGMRAFSRNHPLRHGLALLHIILGANMSSRLFNEIRERKGLAYDIGTAIKRLLDTGAFIVHAGIKNGKLEETAAIIVKELKRLSRVPVSADEFRKAREFYTGQLIMGMEDSLEKMLWSGEQMLIEGKVKDVRRVLREISGVRRSDIMEAAAKILAGGKITAAVVGPVEQNQARKIEEILCA